MKRSVLFLLAFGLYSYVFSQKSDVEKATPSIPQPILIEKVEAKPGELIIPYEKWQLPNGLTVIINEDHSDPIAMISVGYHVGSARESMGKSGFAHFFEHMMFQGSDNVGDEEHFKIIGGAGGNNNAFTAQDLTFYFEEVPSNQLEVALWLEADRMGFLVDAVTKDKFEVQRKTVKNEKIQNQINQPYGLLDEIKGQNLYPPGHPYSWSVIGYTDDLDRANENDLKNFFLKWYCPNNAILTVAGDVNTKEVLDHAVKYFGSIPGGPKVEKQRVPLSVVSVDKYANSRDDIYFPLTEMVFPGVPQYHRDEAALSLLAIIMGDGNNSVFYKNFVKPEKASQASVFHQPSELSGEFTIMVLAYPLLKDGTEITFNDTETLIRKTLDDFEKEGISDDALLRAKAKTRSAITDQGESVLSKALLLSQWEMFADKKMNIQDELDRYEKVTKEDLLRVFNRYIKGRNALFVNIWPLPDDMDPEKRKKFTKESYNPNAEIISDDAQYKGLVYNKAKDNFDRSIKPTPTSSKYAVIPEYYKEKFDNGLEIIGAQSKETQKIAIKIRIDGGHLLEGEKGTLSGSCYLTSALMNEGTQNYTTEEISAQLERLGSTINFFSGTDQTTVVLESFKENLNATLKILEEKLFKPGFREEDFKRVKKQALADIKDQKNDGQTTASKVFNKLMYGKTILGSYYTGSYDDVYKLKLEDLKSYYNKYYSPSVADVVVVGDISKDEVISKLSFLKTWQPKEVKLPTFSKEDFPSYNGIQLYVVHQSDFKTTASNIMIGQMSNPYDATGVYYKSYVMNFALGGSFNSRINLNLREDKGFTYGAWSYFSGNEYPGPYVASATVKPNVTDSAIIEFMKEINKYVKDGITPEELAFTKGNILQKDVLNYETTVQKASYLGNILKYNLPKDYKEQQKNIVKNITADEINKLAGEQIKSNNMVILVVGNKYLIKDQLDALGYGKFKELDKEGE